LDFGAFEDIAPLTLSATHAETTLDVQGRVRLILVSDQAFHMSRTGNPATTNSPRVPANTPVDVVLLAGENISVVMATGGSASKVWIAKAGR
jgi:hypothetical protein